MTVSYLLWRYFKNQQKFLLWGTLLLLSGLLCGASIFLIAQIYNLTVTNDILLWIWILMILPLVYVLKQKEFYYLYMILLSCVLGQFLMSHVFHSVDLRNVVVAYILFGYLILFIWYIHDSFYDDSTLNKLYKLFWWSIITISSLIFFGMSSFFLKEYVLPYSLILIAWILFISLLFRIYYQKQNKIYHILSSFFIIIVWISLHYFNLENLEWNIPVIYLWLSCLIVLFWLLHQYFHHDQGIINLYKFLWLNIWLVSYFTSIAIFELSDWRFLFANPVIWFLTIILIISLFFGIYLENKNLLLLSLILCCVIIWIQFSHIPIINYIIFIFICLIILYLSHSDNEWWVRWLKNLMNIYLYLFLLYLYGKYGREYENKALFFIIGGVLMIGLGLVFSKLNKILWIVLVSNQSIDDN